MAITCAEKTDTERLRNLIAIAERNDGKYECPDEATFRFILAEGGKIGGIKNQLYEDGKFKTACVLADATTGKTVRFCVFTTRAVEW